MAKVTKVLDESVCKDSIQVGDEVLKFNGRDFIDILDYVYADATDCGEMTVKKSGAIQIMEYKKSDSSETIGLEFDDSVEIVPKECCNNCIFCFVKQLPKGLRDTLYIKDDDYRLSFISGSYITCTNLKEADIERILDYKLSPLYISVHATDEEVRKYLLGIKRCAPQLDILKRFVEGGIVLHTQIVLVGGINDGEILKKSLNDLFETGVKSVAIVPVGLTGHRDGLNELKPLTKAQAESVIDIVEKFYETHEGFCYCSDEMYQIADRNVPAAEYYGEYEQIENGVGLIAKFLSELETALQDAPRFVRRKSVAVITGISGERTMRKAAEIVNNRYKKISINVYPVVNKFFGETVTVTGLVTATDIIRCYGDKKFQEDYIMIPSVMLKEFGNVFLDDVSVEELEKKLNKKIVVSRPDGEGFLKSVLRGDKK